MAKAHRLRDILQEAIDLFGTQESAGAAIGISGSRYSRLLGAESVDDNSMGVGSCLRLALVTKHHPSDVLRAAGKAPIADLIEQLYDAKTHGLTERERELLYDWHALDDDRRETVQRVIDLAKPTKRKRATGA